MMTYQPPLSSYFEVSESYQVDGITKVLRLPRLAEPEWEKLWESLGNDEKRFPYWMESWNSQFALEAYIQKYDPDFLQGEVLEIAGGSGGFLQLANLDQCTLYAFSDLIPEAVYFALRQVNHQALCGFALDFTQSCLKHQFGKIIVSDVLYEDRLMAPLLEFLEKTLKVGGEALIADPHRSGREDLYEKLRQMWPHYVNMRHLELKVNGHQKIYRMYQLKK